MRGFTTKAWTNATLAIYGGTVGFHTWTRVDNVTFKRTPAAAVFGTQCGEPTVSPFFEGDARPTDAPAPPAAPIAAASSDRWPRPATRAPRRR